MHAQIKVFLHPGRIQNRDHSTDEFMIRLMRQRGAFRAVVIARNQQHATVFAGARMVGVLEHIAATINAGPFAVPHGKHAVVLCLRIEIELLRAPHRGCGQLLIDPRHERDVRLGEMFLRLPRILINGAKRRAAITRKKTAGVQARVLVDLALQHHQPQQRMRAVHVNAARGQRKPIIKGDVLDCLLNGLRQ